MSDQPAKISTVVVLRAGADVTVYAEGAAPGAGGRLVITRSPDRALPPGFLVLAEPGNLGINPGAPFEMAARGAALFRGFSTWDHFRVIHHGGTETVRAIEVLDGDASGRSGGGAGNGAVGEDEEDDLYRPEEGDDDEQQGVGEGVRYLEDTFTAIHDFMPGGPPELRVRGMVETPTPGHEVKLVVKRPLDFDPTIVPLRLSVRRSAHPQPGPASTVRVEFVRATRRHLTKVHLYPASSGQRDFYVEVQEAH